MPNHTRQKCQAKKSNLERPTSFYRFMASRRIMQPAKRQGKGNRAEIFSQLQKGQNQAQFNVSGTPNPQELFLNIADRVRPS